MKRASANEINSVLSMAPIVNTVQSMYDDFIEANVRIRSEAGLKELIIREAIGGCCEWCSKLAGIYEYGSEPENIFRRHDNCTCIVTHKSEKVYTNVHTKKEFKSQKEARIQNIKDKAVLEKAMHHDKIEQRRKAEDYAAGNTLAMNRLRKKYTTDESLTPSQKERIRRILTGEFPLRQREQKYLQHCEKTVQYENAIKGRKRQQSFLIISEEDAQAIILQYAGTGSSHSSIGAAVTDEFINLDKVIGYYHVKGQTDPVPTKRIQIKYSKKGAHIIPVKDK